jgi:hypothetical protein
MMSKRRSSGDAVRRAQAATAIKKPRPWGLIAGGSALVLFLGGILFYSVQNTGRFAPTPLRDADAKFDGLTVVEDLPPGNHVAGTVDYPQSPPVGGPHNGQWENCGVYTQEIPKEHAVHSMEHGAVWVTYDPAKVTGDALKELTEKVEGEAYGLLSPFPGLKTPVSLQAWGRQLFVDSVDDGDVDEFLDTYLQGPQTPEPGALCSGGVSITGTTPLGGAAATTPATSSPVPQGSATATAPAATPAATPSG